MRGNFSDFDNPEDINEQKEKYKSLSDDQIRAKVNSIIGTANSPSTKEEIQKNIKNLIKNLQDAKNNKLKREDAFKIILGALIQRKERKKQSDEIFMTHSHEPSPTIVEVAMEKISENSEITDKDFDFLKNLIELGGGINEKNENGKDPIKCLKEKILEISKNRENNLQESKLKELMEKLTDHYGEKSDTIKKDKEEKLEKEKLEKKRLTTEKEKNMLDKNIELTVGSNPFSDDSDSKLNSTGNQLAGSPIKKEKKFSFLKLFIAAVSALSNFFKKPFSKSAPVNHWKTIDTSVVVTPKNEYNTKKLANAQNQINNMVVSPSSLRSSNRSNLKRSSSFGPGDN